MDIEQIREYCLNLSADVFECMPFGEDYLVFKNKEDKGKVFVVIVLFESYMCLKCEPEIAQDLRSRYDYVEPAYHFNKKHWNGIFLKQAPSEHIKTWIKHSYELVNNKKTTTKL